METELIRDQRGGAVAVKFSDMSTKELRQLFWVFPEARAEYLVRSTKEYLDRKRTSRSG